LSLVIRNAGINIPLLAVSKKKGLLGLQTQAEDEEENKSKTLLSYLLSLCSFSVLEPSQPHFFFVSFTPEKKREGK
jgi:hypothetical protein